jgi:hypothetical protein
MAKLLGKISNVEDAKEEMRKIRKKPHGIYISRFYK